MKTAIIVLVSMYAGAGIFAGLLMQRAVPALNPVGAAFIAATWPNQIRCARLSAQCDAVPEWIGPYAFTFAEVTP